MHCAPIGDVANEVSYVAVGAQCIYIVLTTYTYLSRFCFLGTTPVLAPNVWANENTNETRDLQIARPTLYLTTTDTTKTYIKL